ncbi:unnamed protein product [Amoebophrya sp. A25]|nr:unnamed protein product [Amoebophrya sp. A25]|eukprot:GSA25T00011512001.1
MYRCRYFMSDVASRRRNEVKFYKVGHDRVNLMTIPGLWTHRGSSLDPHHQKPSLFFDLLCIRLHFKQASATFKIHWYLLDLLEKSAIVDLNLLCRFKHSSL